MYIKPNTNTINIQLHEGKPLPKMPRAKRSDVPKMYRRSIASIILPIVGYIALGLVTLNTVLFFATVL